jgi:hypothetical protein
LALVVAQTYSGYVTAAQTGMPWSWGMPSGMGQGMGQGTGSGHMNGQCGNGMMNGNHNGMMQSGQMNHEQCQQYMAQYGMNMTAEQCQQMKSGCHP